MSQRPSGLGVCSSPGMAAPGVSHTAWPQKLLRSEEQNTFPMGDSAGALMGTSTPSHVGHCLSINTWRSLSRCARLVGLQTNTSPALSMFLIHIQAFAPLLHW